MSEKILVVDDEREIADLLEVYLKNENYTVYKFYNGTDALKCVEETEIDLVILDIMLPDIDGFRICQKIREKFYFPVIMLTAKVEDGEKIMGLTIGADDYITKPFNPLEVVARVKTQLRRYQRYNNPAQIQPAEKSEYDIRGLIINKDSHKCFLYSKGAIVMARKRLTEMFPFLLPLRRWQKKQCCYLKMKFDKNVYADKISESLFPNVVFETSALMVNENSGFDIQFQYNKVHNLQLAAKTMDKLVIAPNETFSFFWLTRHADRYTRYKDGLNLVNGKIVGSYGGGLCQLSNMLFWLFLHTPMTIVERHGHAAESFPSTTEDLPCGTDATVSEGWLDLKVRNDTDNTFQIAIHFDDNYMYGEILSQRPVNTEYTVFNSSVSYIKRNEKIYQVSVVCREETDQETGEHTQRELYTNQCEISYSLPDNIEVKSLD